ncbi:response regulator transcription factor [Bradyrhizobium elkanii]|uniref:response regulator transcription factor n=1 Tax=Bradyrhizobium elkanii TaxID=29448 RepID=UPI0005C13511|nr:response regulator [Bradyrhizobium elkanii]KIU48715.1 histidine kinase [Bradyrhizobium elkanii]
MPIKPSIAVIDDDEAIRDATVGLLRSVGFIAKAFPSAEDFLNSNRIRITTCLIADVKMTGMSGLELYGRLAALGAPIPTILITAYPDDQTRARALNAGVTGYLTKPFSERELLDCIDLAFGHEVLYAPLKQ